MFKQNREPSKPNKTKSVDTPTPPEKEKPIKKTASYDSGPVASSSKTVIGTNVVIEGNVQGTENLVVDGVVKGNINAPDHQVTIGPKGRIEGEIKANDAVIGGLLQGKVKAAGRVEVTQKADFYGEIKCKSISVQDGAYFKGIIELQREPHREKQSGGPKIEPIKEAPSKVAPLASAEAAKEK